VNRIQNAGTDPFTFKAIIIAQSAGYPKATPASSGSVRGNSIDSGELRSRAPSFPGGPGTDDPGIGAKLRAASSSPPQVVLSRNAGFSRQILTIPVPLPHECGVPGGPDAAVRQTQSWQVRLDKARLARGELDMLGGESPGTRISIQLRPI
jgi:hypothetical protein